MLIFNTTFLAHQKVHDAFMQWLLEEYIPHMKNQGLFSQPQVAKVNIDNQNLDENSYSVQFHTPDMNELNAWREKEEKIILEKLFANFGTDVLSFSSVLDIVYSE